MCLLSDDTDVTVMYRIGDFWRCYTRRREQTFLHRAALPACLSS